MTSAGSRRRILFLLPFPPDPEGLHGGARVIGQLLACLAERHEVGAVYLRAARDAPLAESLRRRLGLELEVRRPEPSSAPAQAARAVKRFGGLLRGRPVWATDWTVRAFATRSSEVVQRWRPDVVQAEFHVMGQYLLPRVMGAACVLVEHEPGAPAAADLARAGHGPRRALRLLDSLAWRRYERDLLRRADAAVVFTEHDRQALLARCPSAHVVRIRPGVPLTAQPVFAGGDLPRILYIGSFIHPPNVTGALRLAREVFPAVRARRPDAILEIVGDAPPPAVRDLEGDGIVVVGRVDDAAPYLARAAIVAAPLEHGGGIRVKLLEAFAAGRSVVATPRALAGLEVVPGEHALVATTDGEFATALVTLLDDPVRRANLGRAARAWAEIHLRWSDVVTRYESLYEDLLAATGSAARA